MNTRTGQRRHSREVTGWTPGEKSLIATTAGHAPPVHTTQPWVLEFRDPHRISLYERLDLVLSRHDPLGRDRLISCGMALEHVRLAVRVLGWSADLTLFPDAARPDEVGRLTSAGRAKPSDVELARFAALAGREGHREPFAARTTDDEDRALLTAHSTTGAGLRPVRGADELTALARLLHHNALVLTDDPTDQRELLVVETPDDGPHDHVRAGLAAARTWFAATAAGLAASVLTLPFHLPEVRAGLVEILSLNGFPQLLLRIDDPIGQREER